MAHAGAGGGGGGARVQHWGMLRGSCRWGQGWSVKLTAGWVCVRVSTFASVSL